MDTPLPVNYVRTRAVVGDGYLYHLGGLGDKGICGTPDVHYAPLRPDGSVGPWTPTTPLPGLGSQTLTVTCAETAYELSDVILAWGYQALFAAGYLYVLGGQQRAFNGFEDGSTIRFSSRVYFARVNADGSLGSWQRGPDMPAASFFGAGAAADGVLYMTGGRDDANSSSSSRAVHYSRLGPDGVPGTWQTASDALPGGLSLHAAQAVGGRLYVSGGMTWDPFPQDQITDAVFSAPLTVDGAPGAWRGESSLAVGLAAHGLQARHGVLYTLGGQEPVWPTVNIHMSPLGADGVLAAWSDSDPLPVPLFNHGSAASEDTLYVAGGNNGESNQRGVYSLRDAVPPAAVADLALEPVDATSLRATWTAPGNDGAAGAVAGGRYELRVSADPAALDSAAPQTWAASFAPGEPQSRVLSGLSAATVYYASLRAADSAGNLSAGSNVASARTAEPPGPPPNPVPSVSSLSPASATAGDPALTLVVRGSGFVAGSSVRWNGSERPTTFVSGEELAAELGAAELAAAGAAGVAVSNPAPGGGVSATLAFMVLNPAPTLAALSPASARVGSPALTVVLSGSRFVAGSVARLDGQERPTTVLDASRLEARLSEADVAAAGVRSLAVATPGPGGGVSPALPFTVENPAPAIALISPSAADAGSAAFTLAVEGSAFLPGSVVRWEGADRPTTYVSASRLTAAIPASDVAAAGSAAVTVFNPGPGGGASEPATFTVQKPAPPPNPTPEISSLSPSSSLAGASALTVTVKGSGFVAASVARVDGADRPTTLVSPTRLEATLLAEDLAAAGSLALSVSNPAPGGGVSAAAQFSVLNPEPVVASVSPASALAGSGELTLVVDGSGFVPGSTLRWNGAERPTTLVSATRLAARVPASDLAAAGVASLTVANPAPGGGVSGAASFSVLNPAPALASLSPASAPMGSPGLTLTAQGAGFVAGTTLRFNGAARTTRVLSATRLEAEFPASDLAAAGAADVTVWSPAPGGGASAALRFEVSSRPAELAAAFHPATLNLKSNGAKAKASLSDGEAPAREVDGQTAKLTEVDGREVEALPALSAKLEDDGTLTLTFDRQELERRLQPGDRTLTIAGALKGGRAFRADGALRVIAPGAGGAPSGVSPVAAPAAPKPRFWPAPEALRKLQIRADGSEDLSYAVKGRGRSVAKGGVRVRVPENATPAPVEVTIDLQAAEAAPDKEIRKRETERKGLIEVSAAAVFGPEGTVFAQPVTLELPYDPAALPTGTDESRLAVHYWNPHARAWERLASTVDRSARVVRAQTSHFSTYQVLVGVAAAGDIALVDGYAFPNPVRGDGLVTLRIQPGPAETVEFNVYDLAGRRVHSTNDFVYRAAFDDGNGKGPQDTYDHVWNVSGVGSGVYRYVISARKAGKKDVVKAGKVAVVK